METKNVGLRDIPVADTKISSIDGEKGKLIYRGYDILDLTRRSNFSLKNLPFPISEIFDIVILGTCEKMRVL